MFESDDMLKKYPRLMRITKQWMAMVASAEKVTMEEGTEPPVRRRGLRMQDMTEVNQTARAHSSDYFLLLRFARLVRW